MRSSSLFYAAIAVAVIAALIAVYYAIPLDTHILAASPGPHYKHAGAFAALAVIAIIAALVTRPKSTTTTTL